MSKNIKIRQKNSSNEYDILYPQSAADIVMLSEETSTAYSLTNGTAEDAIESLSELLTAQRKISLKITDVGGNPIEGATVSGLVGSPVTDTNGYVTGIVQNNVVTIYPPSKYPDLKSTSVNVSSYIGKLSIHAIPIPVVSNNTIIRYTESSQIRFSAGTKSIDVCCVGAGGGGGGYYAGTESQVGGGGGGGGIINMYNISVTPYMDYTITVGAGGNAASPDVGGDGGNSSFSNIVVANGGSGGTPASGGTSGSSTSGAGGYKSDGTASSIVTEFDDSTTFYSGGGGGGKEASTETSGSVYKGGSPNGASGALHLKNSQTQAGTAGIGGGGGGGVYTYTYVNFHEKRTIILPSAGGAGLVAIRIHTDY